MRTASNTTQLVASLAYSRVKCIEKNLFPSVNSVSDPRPRMDYRLAGLQMGSDDVCRDEELSHDRCGSDIAGSPAPMSSSYFALRSGL